MPAIVSISIYTYHVNQNSPVPRGHGITSDDLDGLCLGMQRGGAKSLYELPQQLKAINEEKMHFDVIVIDALYKALPKDIDENSNGPPGFTI